MDMNTLVQVRRSVIVIPDLIREPVVCRNVVMRGCFHSGSRIKSGMNDYRLLGLEEGVFIRMFLYQIYVNLLCPHVSKKRILVVTL